MCVVLEFSVQMHACINSFLDFMFLLCFFLCRDKDLPYDDECMMMSNQMQTYVLVMMSKLVLAIHTCMYMLSYACMYSFD